MESRNNKTSKRELSSKQVFQQMFVSQFKQYKTHVLKYIEEKQDKPKVVKSKDKLKIHGRTSSGGSRAILSALNIGSGLSPKLLRYENAKDVMNRENFAKEIKFIAKLLGMMYQDLLDKCTHQDALTFANACVELITSRLEKKEVSFVELMRPATIQQCLVDTVRETPKLKLSMQPKMKINERTVYDAIVRPVLYCADNRVFYKNAYANAVEFGFIQFEKLDEVIECQNLLYKINKKYEYKPIKDDVSKLLRRGSFLEQQTDSEESSNVAALTPRAEEEANESSIDEKQSWSVS